VGRGEMSSMRDASMCSASRCLSSLTSKSLEALNFSQQSRQVIVEQMKQYLIRLGLYEEMKKLRIIHIAGTKGKGSTSAFIESLALSHQLTTGLYTSPHLVNINERFRLNGKPVTDQLYLKHFWSVWNKLSAYEENSKNVNHRSELAKLPMFFRFLTLVSFSIFIEQKVDLLILEVGLGGKLDSTNVVETPIVCGITSIGYDHMEILGNSLSLIAAEKAGIAKQDVPVLTTLNQAEETLITLQRCVTEEQTTLTTIKPFEANQYKLGLSGLHQLENAALAVELFQRFCQRCKITSNPSYRLNVEPKAELIAAGLAAVYWPGRCEVVAHPTQKNLIFFIDGAHTDQSMQACCHWFASINSNIETTQGEQNDPSAEHKQDNGSAEESLAFLTPTPSLIGCSVYYSLLFNCGQVRNPLDLLLPVINLGYNESNNGSSPLTQFGHVLINPFDDDRPHLTELPSIHQLIQQFNNSSLQQRLAQLHQSNVTQDGKASIQANEWQHKLMQLFKLLLQAKEQQINSDPHKAQGQTKPYLQPITEFHNSMRSSVERLVQLARAHPSVQFRVLACGSLYLVGNLFKVLQHNI
jgi:folylpolyglutamate synthase